uniref:hypothetical protein n=1 Tax=Marinobacter nauticus TaxID=2743 RepID=UPI00224C514E|nr:hypothetical protein [Marinobacter nauticus]
MGAVRLQAVVPVAGGAKVVRVAMDLFPEVGAEVPTVGLLPFVAVLAGRALEGASA